MAGNSCQACGGMVCRADKWLHSLRLDTMWSPGKPPDPETFSLWLCMACIRIECTVAIPWGYKIVLGKQKTVRRLSRRQGSSEAFGEPLTCVTTAENSETLKDSSIRLTGVAWGLHHHYDQQRVESWCTRPLIQRPQCERCLGFLVQKLDNR